MNLRKINPAITPTLKKGGVGVMPTDTIYGIVGSALNAKTVKRIYALRRRNPRKPMIILLGSPEEIKKFGIMPTPKIKKSLKKIWPGPVSVVLPIARPATKKKFHYLHRGTGGLAFRVPQPAWLRDLLEKTGPLVAPSANFEGETPAKNVREAKKYFDNKVDFYVDAGRLVSKPSTLITFEDNTIKFLRKGMGIAKIRMLQ